MRTHLRHQLAGVLFVAMAFSSVACASHGDLMTLRAELQRNLSQTRNEQLQAAEALQHRLNELQTVQQRQQTNLDALQTAVKDLKGQPEVLKRVIDELKGKMDLMAQDVGRLHGSVRVWNDRVLQSLRTEQEELRNRLKTVDRALHDLEAAGMPTHIKTAVPHEGERKNIEAHPASGIEPGAR